MQLFRSPYILEQLGEQLVKLNSIDDIGVHSRFQFKVINNCADSLGLLTIKHEISHHTDTYYYEIPVSYKILKENCHCINGEVLLRHIINTICIFHKYNLLPSNLVISPEAIYINDLQQIKLMYIPRKHQFVYSSLDILRMILLMCSSLNVTIHPNIFVELLNLDCDENEVFSRAYEVVSKFEKEIEIIPPIKRRKSIMKLLKEMFFDVNDKTMNNETTLLSNQTSFKKVGTCKLVDEENGEHLIKNGETFLGRDSICDIQINDPSISRKHLVIHEMNSVVQIKDLNSANGTLLNGSKMQPNHWYMLKDSDLIRLANHKLWLNRIS